MTEQEFFWIYENHIKRYAAIHRAECGFCNRGEGVGGGYNRHHAAWMGPYESLDDAAHKLLARISTLHDIRYCTRCF